MSDAATTATDAAEEDLSDGRRRRGARSREAVVEAMLALIREGDLKPSASDIAERAGVSVRSVFRHFDDLDSLYSLAVERQIARIAPLLALGELPADLDDRVDRIVASRAALFEDITRVRHVGEFLAARSPVLAHHLEQTSAWMRDQVREVFAAELRAAEDRRSLLDALDATLSWRFWVALREDQGCSLARTRAVTASVVRSLLA